MTIDIGTQGQPDFSQPIELMMDCHRRIERFLKVLQNVVWRYRGGGLDEEGHRALETALNYFHQAAPRHTEDEEESLFPCMRKSDDAKVQQAMAELDRLEADHRKAEAAHQRVDQLGRRWLAEKQLDKREVAELESLLAELAQAYAEHIRLEDEQVFVLAQEALDESSLSRVGEEMKQRRAASPGRPGSRCAERRQAYRTS